MTARAERETLSSFLVDLQAGSHPALLLEEMRPEEALALCEVSARDAREKFVRGGGRQSDLEFANATAPFLRALVDSARAEGWTGAFLAVNARKSVDDHGAERHAGAERATSIHRIDGMRILCIYDPETISRFGTGGLLRVGLSHDEILTPAQGRLA